MRRRCEFSSVRRWGVGRSWWSDTVCVRRHAPTLSTVTYWYIELYRVIYSCVELCRVVLCHAPTLSTVRVSPCLPGGPVSLSPCLSVSPSLPSSVSPSSVSLSSFSPVAPTLSTKYRNISPTMPLHGVTKLSDIGNHPADICQCHGSAG